MRVSEVPRLVWMRVCTCMHLQCMSIVLQVCNNTVAYNFPERECPVLSGQSYCREVQSTNHRVTASHFAYWVSCYLGQRCWNTSPSSTPNTWRHCINTVLTQTEFHTPTQTHLQTHAHGRINIKHSSHHMPTHSSLENMRRFLHI